MEVWIKKPTDKLKWYYKRYQIIKINGRKGKPEEQKLQGTKSK